MKKLRIVLFLLPVGFVVLTCIIGFIYTRRGFIFGPYKAERCQAVYFQYPAITGIVVQSFGRCASFCDEDKNGKFDNREWIANYDFYTTAKHLKSMPGFSAKDRSKLVSCEFMVNFSNILHKFKGETLLVAGCLILLSMWFSRSGALLLLWWWYSFCWLIGEVLLLGGLQLAREFSGGFDNFMDGLINRFIFDKVLLGQFAPARFMSPDAARWFAFLFFIMVPFIALIMGIVYLTRHLYPRRKREIEVNSKPAHHT